MPHVRALTNPPMKPTRSLYEAINDREGGKFGHAQCRACGMIVTRCRNKYCSARPMKWLDEAEKRDKAYG